MRFAKLFLFVASAAALLNASPAQDVGGTWNAVVNDGGGGTGKVRMVLKQAGGQVSGMVGPSEKAKLPQIYDAKLEGNHLTFSVDDSDDHGLRLTYHFDLTVDGDRIRGKANGSSADHTWVLEFTATREK